MELTRLLRKRGLSLQTAKTHILPVEQARSTVEALTKVLVEVRDQFMAEIREFVDATGYLPFDEAEGLLASSATDGVDPSETPILVIREAFEQYFIHAAEVDGDIVLLR